jgi:hypothetical protein
MYITALLLVSTLESHLRVGLNRAKKGEITTYFAWQKLFNHDQNEREKNIVLSKSIIFTAKRMMYPMHIIFSMTHLLLQFSIKYICCN